jgi:hypothetical protein
MVFGICVSDLVAGKGRSGYHGQSVTGFTNMGGRKVVMSKMVIQIITPLAAAAATTVITLAMTGCISINKGPRTRLGAYPANVIGTRFADANTLGKHSYRYSLSEGGGIAYTCRGGHVDLDHLRIAADYTKYLSQKSYSHLLKGDKDFTFGLNVDPSKFFVELRYPADWGDLPKEEKEKIAKEASIEFGAYLTYTMVSWHEILTWYGFHTVGFLPEFPSAFSWEDNYSNLLGTRLGVQALQDTSKKYDEAMTILIKQELEKLGIQSAKTAKDASEKMRGKWFSGIFVPDITERNMDIGLDDGYVTPTLVPGICPGVNPQSYPIPALDSFYKHGFSITLEVEPHTWEQHRIFKVVYPQGNGTRIRLPEDLPAILDDMKQEARKLGYNAMPKK